MFPFEATIEPNEPLIVVDLAACLTVADPETKKKQFVARAVEDPLNKEFTTVEKNAESIPVVTFFSEVSPYILPSDSTLSVLVENESINAPAINPNLTTFATTANTIIASCDSYIYTVV